MSTPTPSYSERLRPSMAAWLLVPVGAAMAGASAFPLGLGVAVGAAVVVGGVVALLLVGAVPRVEVSSAGFRAGRAFLEAAFLGEVEPLDIEQTRAALGPQLRADAFVVHRSWVRSAVRVEVVDDADTTPYWVVSTRRPERLAEALVVCRQLASGRGDQAAHSEQTGWPPSE